MTLSADGQGHTHKLRCAKAPELIETKINISRRSTATIGTTIKPLAKLRNNSSSGGGKRTNILYSVWLLA